MGRGPRVVALVCLLVVVVAGGTYWFVSRDTSGAQVRAAVEESLDGDGEIELGSLLEEQDASAWVVVCPYMPPAVVEADTGVRVTETSNERDEASVDLVFAAGSEVRSVAALPTRRYDVCSGLGDYEMVPVFGPDAVLSVREGDALSGEAEILISLVQ